MRDADADEAPRRDNITRGRFSHRQPPPKSSTSGFIEYDDGNIKVYYSITVADLNLDQSWLIEGLLLDATTAELTGPQKSGKSMALMAMHHAIAHGNRYLGLDSEQGCSIYIAAERPVFARQNLYGYDLHYQTNSDNLIGLAEWKGLDLVAAEPEEIIGRIDKIARELKKRSGLPLKLISIDTLARATPHSDESIRDYSSVNNIVNEIADHFEACVMLTRHYGKDRRRGARGASNLGYGAASVITIDKERESDRDGFIAMEECSKSMFEGKEFGFKTQIIEVGRDPKGRPVTTRVMLYDNVVKINRQKLKRSTHDAELVQLFSPVFAAGRRNLPTWIRAKADYHADSYATKEDLLNAISAAYPTDAAKRKLLRQAFERMLEKGEWFGSTKRPRSDEVAVWPRNGWLAEEGENDQDS